MTNLKNEIWQSLKLILLAFVFSVGISYVFAWTGPTATAPNGNTPAPINVSATSQVKSGGLGVTNLVADNVVAGLISSTVSGIKFPDNTIQTTAAGGVNFPSGMVAWFSAQPCPSGWTQKGTTISDHLYVPYSVDGHTLAYKYVGYSQHYLCRKD